MANLKDIAKACGLSVATVSRVFNEPQKVSPKTRALVLETAEKLNFSLNQVASALRSGKSKSIGVLLPFINNHVFASAIKAMEEVFRAAAYSLIISQSHESLEKEEEALENFRRLQLDGVLLSISKERERMGKWDTLKNFPAPLLLFDRNIANDEIPSVHIDNILAAYTATMHLIEQGCTSLLHLGGNESLTIFQERLEGFEKAVQSEKNVKGSLIRDFDPRSEESNRVFRKLLGRNSGIDAILAHGDIAALHAIQLLQELGKKIPEDVAVVGFGNSRFCSYISPGLSSVDQANEALGKLAAQKLLAQLEGRTERMDSHVLTAELVVRGSSLRESYRH
ncbi:MAG: LacI family DNA-binding transcriptional regulator [Bacteroidia bacterium]|nr:LacI family DNA-binding transcriptional regulator [Bacteroidia bacterium]